MGTKKNILTFVLCLAAVIVMGLVVILIKAKVKPSADWQAEVQYSTVYITAARDKELKLSFANSNETLDTVVTQNRQVVLTGLIPDTVYKLTDNRGSSTKFETKSMPASRSIAESGGIVFYRRGWSTEMDTRLLGSSLMPQMDSIRLKEAPAGEQPYEYIVCYDTHWRNPSEVRQDDTWAVIRASDGKIEGIRLKQTGDISEYTKVTFPMSNLIDAWHKDGGITGGQTKVEIYMGDYLLASQTVEIVIE